MFHILDFIDSKDIRAYNADTQFTLIEQAVLNKMEAGQLLFLYASFGENAYHTIYKK